MLPLPTIAGISQYPPPVSVELRVVEPKPKPELVEAVDPQNGVVIKVTMYVFNDSEVEIILKPEASKNSIPLPR